MEIERSAGVLLHPTCLPSSFGIGDLGPGARRYLEWLADAGIRWWQVLPLNPPGAGFSPYSARSTFAVNTLLISPEAMAVDGLIDGSDLEAYPALPAERVEYAAVAAAKERLLRSAWSRLEGRPPGAVGEAFERFCSDEAAWLDDWALFDALQRANGGAAWTEWPVPLRDRDPDALAVWEAEHRQEVAYSRFCQWLCFRQWETLRERARALGISILGDLPIFVAHDSAEVWANRELFRLDDAGRPLVVAGVPPDYFSETGQLWGNPLYDWERMAQDGYRWWVRRLGHSMRFADVLRLDHFRGFAGFWEIPAGAETAAGGRWVEGPGEALFTALEGALGGLPFVAEDLGTITPDVHALRHRLGLPGMAVLQFAFTPEPRSAYLPYRLTRETVVYTGTHDNDTTVGWWSGGASEVERDFARRYMATDGREIHWDMIRLAMASVADLAIVPHQDLAGLGSDCRMNVPGRAEGNWAFRITEWMLDVTIQDRLRELVRIYGR